MVTFIAGLIVGSGAAYLFFYRKNQKLQNALSAVVKRVGQTGGEVFKDVLDIVIKHTKK